MAAGLGNTTFLYQFLDRNRPPHQIVQTNRPATVLEGMWTTETKSLGFSGNPTFTCFYAGKIPDELSEDDLNILKIFEESYCKTQTTAQLIISLRTHDFS